MPRKTTTTANKTSENMKTKRKSEKLCFTVCDVILCFLMVFVSLKDVVDAGMSNDSQKILSRRRRYLTFPEGSSFQVVYETYQPVVDYGNLLIFYLTQALAWELPHSPYYPEEHLQDLWDDVVFPDERYEDDELSINKQVPIVANTNINQNQFQGANTITDQNQFQGANTITDQNQFQGANTITDQNQLQDKNNADRNSNSNVTQNLQRNRVQNPNPQGVQFQNRNGEEKSGNDYYANGYNPSAPNNYYSNNPNPSVPNRYYYSNYRNPAKLSDTIKPLTKMVSNKMDYYLSYADKVLSQIGNFATNDQKPWKKTGWGYTESEPSYYEENEVSDADRRKYAFEQSRNFIHPVFGKRSTDQIKTPEEAFNLNYHRTSRQTMYRKIAKFLNTDEINGAECVLKALCETGKRRDTDKKPGPFLMEILRVVFSLPETERKETHPVYSQYDQAHNTPMDCDELFPKCKSSLWNKNEILQ